MKVYSLTTHEQIEQLAEKFPHRLIIIDFWATLVWTLYGNERYVF